MYHSVYCYKRFFIICINYIITIFLTQSSIFLSVAVTTSVTSSDLLCCYNNLKLGKPGVLHVMTSTFSLEDGAVVLTVQTGTTHCTHLLRYSLSLCTLHQILNGILKQYICVTHYFEQKVLYTLPSLFLSL